MASQRTGHTLMIWSRLSKWLLPSVNIIQPGCWSCHQHSKAASAISATCSMREHATASATPLSLESHAEWPLENQESQPHDCQGTAMDVRETELANL